MSEQESNKMLNEFGNFIPVTQSTPMLMPELGKKKKKYKKKRERKTQKREKTQKEKQE